MPPAPAGRGDGRHHGLFVPDLAAPRGRMMMVPRVDDEVEIDGRWIALTGAEYEDGRIGGETARHLKQFRWEWQTPAGGRWSIWLRNNWSRPSACEVWHPTTGITNRHMTAICDHATQRIINGRCGPG